MNVDWNLVVSIAIPFATLLLGIWLNRRFERQAKLISWLGHIAQFKTGEMQVYTHAIAVRNDGKLAANNVRIRHAWLPNSYQVYPALSYRIEPMEGGGADMVFEKLVPGEQISIQYLYFEPRDVDMIHRDVKCDEGFAKVIPMLLSRVYPRWAIRISRVLFAVGICASVYLLIEVCKWIYRLVVLTH